MTNGGSKRESAAARTLFVHGALLALFVGAFLSSLLSTYFALGSCWSREVTVEGVTCKYEIYLIINPILIAIHVL